MIKTQKSLVNLNFRNFHLEDQFSEAEFDRAVGVLGTNAFECCQGGGQALFPTISLLSHSCLANAWIQVKNYEQMTAILHFYSSKKVQKPSE